MSIVDGSGNLANPLGSSWRQSLQNGSVVPWVCFQHLQCVLVETFICQASQLIGRSQRLAKSPQRKQMTCSQHRPLHVCQCATLGIWQGCAPGIHFLGQASALHIPLHRGSRFGVWTPPVVLARLLLNQISVTMWVFPRPFMQDMMGVALRVFCSRACVLKTCRLRT